MSNSEIGSPSNPSGDPASPAPLREAVWKRLLRRPSLLGTLVAAWFFAQSVGPSMLARSWLFQGVLTGVSVVLGYAIGLGLTRVGKYLRRRYGWGSQPLPPTHDQSLRLVVATVVLAYAVWTAVRAVP